MTRWLERRALRRLAAGREGRLLYVNERGEVVDLGAYTHAELVSMTWAVRVAYRLTRARDERSRLGAVRDAAARLGHALEKVSRKGVHEG